MAPMQMDKSSCNHDGSQQNQLNGHIGNGGSNHDQDPKPADAAGGHAPGRAENGAVGGGKRPVCDEPSFYTAGNNFKDSETGTFNKKGKSAEGRHKEGSRDEGCNKMDKSSCKRDGSQQNQLNGHIGNGGSNHDQDPKPADAAGVLAPGRAENGAVGGGKRPVFYVPSFYTAGNNFMDSETGTFNKKGKSAEGRHKEGSRDEGCNKMDKSSCKRDGSQQNQLNGHIGNGGSNHDQDPKPADAAGVLAPGRAENGAVGGGKRPVFYVPSFYTAGNNFMDSETGTFNKKGKSAEGRHKEGSRDEGCNKMDKSSCKRDGSQQNQLNGHIGNGGSNHDQDPKPADAAGVLAPGRAENGAVGGGKRPVFYVPSFYTAGNNFMDSETGTFNKKGKSAEGRHKEGSRDEGCNKMDKSSCKRDGSQQNQLNGHIGNGGSNHDQDPKPVDAAGVLAPGRAENGAVGGGKRPVFYVPSFYTAGNNFMDSETGTFNKKGKSAEGRHKEGSRDEGCNKMDKSSCKRDGSQQNQLNGHIGNGGSNHDQDPKPADAAGVLAPGRAENGAVGGGKRPVFYVPSFYTAGNNFMDSETGTFNKKGKSAEGRHKEGSRDEGCNKMDKSSCKRDGSQQNQLNGHIGNGGSNHDQDPKPADAAGVLAPGRAENGAVGGGKRPVFYVPSFYTAGNNFMDSETGTFNKKGKSAEGRHKEGSRDEGCNKMDKSSCKRDGSQQNQLNGHIGNGGSNHDQDPKPADAASVLAPGRAENGAVGGGKRPVFFVPSFYTAGNNFKDSETGTFNKKGKSAEGRHKEGSRDEGCNKMDKSSCKRDGSQQNQLNGHIGNGGSNHDQDPKPADAAGVLAPGRAENGAVGGGKRPVFFVPSFYTAGNNFKDSETGTFNKKGKSAEGRHKEGSRDEGCNKMDKSSCKRDGSQQNQLNGHIGNGGSNHDQDTKPADAAGVLAPGRAENGAVGGGKRPVFFVPSFYTAGNNFKDSETGTFNKKGKSAEGRHKEGSRDEGCNKMDKSSCKRDGSQQNQLNGHIGNGGSNHDQDPKPADAAGVLAPGRAENGAVGGGKRPVFFVPSFYTAGNNFKDSETGTFNKKGKSAEGRHKEGSRDEGCNKMDKSSCKRDGSQQNQLNGHIGNGGSNHDQDPKPADAAGVLAPGRAENGAVGGGKRPVFFVPSFYTAGNNFKDSETGTFNKKGKSAEGRHKEGSRDEGCNKYKM
ncbi:hypothetical protein Ancab_015435 [Ancistrocladus abbreviatus]